MGEPFLSIARKIRTIQSKALVRSVPDSIPKHLDGVVQLLVLELPITYFEHTLLEVTLPGHELQHADTAEDLRAPH